MMVPKQDASVVALALIVALAAPTKLSAASLEGSPVLAQAPTPTVSPTETVSPGTTAPTTAVPQTTSAPVQSATSGSPPWWVWLVPILMIAGLTWWERRRSRRVATPSVSDRPTTLPVQDAPELSPPVVPPTPTPEIPPVATEVFPETPVPPLGTPTVPPIVPEVESPGVNEPELPISSEDIISPDTIIPADEPVVEPPIVIIDNRQTVDTPPEEALPELPNAAIAETPEPPAIVEPARVEPEPEPPSVEFSVALAGAELLVSPPAEDPVVITELDAGAGSDTVAAEISPETIVPADQLPLESGLPGTAWAAGVEALAWTEQSDGDVTPEPTDPDLAQSTVEATKFDVGQPDLSQEALAAVDEGLSELPGGYDQSQIILMPRDPQWAYAYWDTPDSHKQALRQQGGQRLALRLYDVTGIDLSEQNPHNLQQYECDELTRDWHLPIPVSDRDYIAEIGYLTEDGRWLLLARSAPAHMPPLYPTNWSDEQLLTLAWDDDLRGRVFLDLVPPDPPTRNPDLYEKLFNLSQVAAAQRLAGSLYGSMQHGVSSFGMYPSGAGMMSGVGMMSGIGLSGLTTSGMGMSGVGMYSTSGVGLSGLTTSGIGMSGVGMGMSGIGMSGFGLGFSASAPPIRSRKFWLIADAELIVYGATEPDATLMIGGRPIQLNPDGTFRLQMSFQDGKLDFPILAIAADGEQTRSIHMEFNRNTPHRHTNTKDDAFEEWF